MYTPDNYDQFKRHDAKQEAELDRLPRCSECDQPIQDDFCFEVNDELICEECMHDNHRKCVEDFID